MNDTANVLDKFDRKTVTFLDRLDPRTGKDIEVSRPAFVYNDFALIDIDEHWIILHVPTKSFSAVNQGAVFHKIEDAANFVVDLLGTPDWQEFAKSPDEGSKAPKDFCDRVHAIAKKNNACKGHLEQYSADPAESVKKILAAIFGESMVQEAEKTNEDELTFIGDFISAHHPELLDKAKATPREAALDLMKSRRTIQDEYIRQRGRPMPRMARELLGVAFLAGTDFIVVKKETK